MHDLVFYLLSHTYGTRDGVMWGVAFQNMSSQEDPAEMSGGPVAPVGVAVVCH
jgi:hypothetical protein